MYNIMLAGGGTAGHIMPNLALVPLLKKKFDRIYYMGGNGMEETLTKKAGLPFFKTDVVKFRRSNILLNFKIPFTLKKAIKQAKSILVDTKTDIVFSKGGYASLPACLAARSLKLPIITHESDFSMGLANKLICKFATATITSFPETAGGTFIGTPIRDSVLKGNAEIAKKQFALSNRPTILVFGGSSGAIAINSALLGAIEYLTKTYNIIHITGASNTEGTTVDSAHNAENNKFYKQIAFSDNIGDLMAAADIIVTRGGANALAETTALGKRIICIPLPKGNSRGDQLDNAISYKKRGLITVLNQNELNAKTLIDAISAIADKPELPKQCSDVNAKIVAFICKTLAQHTTNR